MDVYPKLRCKKCCKHGTGYFLHGSDQSSEDHPGCREAHVFSGFSWQVIQVDKSSILAGPAEDVVEKWPWLKAAEHDSSYTLSISKETLKKMLLEKGLLKTWKR